MSTGRGSLRYDPEWLASAVAGRAGTIGEVEIHIDRIERRADRVELSIRYSCGSGEWTQHFGTVPMNDDEIAAELAEAKFDAPTWIDRRWGRARRSSGR